METGKQDKATEQTLQATVQGALEQHNPELDRSATLGMQRCFGVRCALYAIG